MYLLAVHLLAHISIDFTNDPDKFNIFISTEHKLVDFAKINFHHLGLHETQDIIILRTKSTDTGKIIHTLPEINQCCNGTEWNHEIHQLLKFDAEDGMQRISCNISTEVFNRDYVMKSKSVVLTNCTENWKAKHWTFEGIILL